MKTIIFIVKFLILGALFIVSNNNLALSDEGSFSEFSGIYYEWISSLSEKGKAVTGYMITDVDWLPRIDSDPSLKNEG